MATKQYQPRQPMTRMSIQIPTVTKKWLEQLAAERNESLNYLIALAVLNLQGADLDEIAERLERSTDP